MVDKFCYNLAPTNLFHFTFRSFCALSLTPPSSSCSCPSKVSGHTRGGEESKRVVEWPQTILQIQDLGEQRNAKPDRDHVEKEARLGVAGGGGRWIFLAFWVCSSCCSGCLGDCSIPDQLCSSLENNFLYHHHSGTFLIFLLMLNVLFPSSQVCHLGWSEWCNLSSLQSLPPGLNDPRASAPPSSWDYRCMPPHSANFCIFNRDGVHHIGQAGLELLTSTLWEAEAVDHLRSGVQDQPGQHGETPCLLKI
ncbi:UPF0764 protein C16orf89 [Plecturocebus cupreus]